MAGERSDYIHHQVPEGTRNSGQSETQTSQGVPKTRRSHTSETRAKISAAHIGKNVSYDTGVKISESQRKRWAKRKVQIQAEKEMSQRESQKAEAEETAKLIFGVAAAVGKCAVSSLAHNITFFPGVWRVRNAWKITAWIEANWRGFLATL